MSSDLNKLDEELSEIDNWGGGETRQRRVSGPKALPIAVAAVALIGFGAIVWYAYNQGVRSGSEDAAPLLTPDGPAKVQPEDPGGINVPHQDKLVYNRVDPSVDDTRVERLLPPPEAPKEPPKAAEAPADQASEPASTEAEGTTPRAPQPAASSGEPPLPTPELAAPSAPPPTAGQEGSASSTPKVEPVAPAKKPEPAPKAEAAKKPEAEKPAAKVAAAKSLSASFRVQVSAVKSSAAARTEWSRQQKKFPDLLGPLTLEVQEIKTQKGTFYRVRGGPLADRASAQSICEQMKKRKAACIIVAPGG